MALRVNDTLKQLRPVDVFENGISNEDAADSIPRPVTTPDDTSTSGKAVPTAATILYYKLFGYVQIAGATLPMFSVIFGAVINALGGSPTIAELVHQVDKVCLYFIYLGIVAFVASYGELGLWMRTGVRQANKIRHAYLAAVLQQEVAFFDVEASSGKLLNSLNEDTVTIQNAIGEKVGNFVHHMSACVVGLAIAFARGWDIALVILAGIPILGVVIGGITYFTNKITREQSDSYGVANGIASEALAAIRTVLSFNGEERTVRRYGMSLTRPMQVGIKAGALNGVTIGSAQCFFMCGYALALWYGGIRVRAGKYTGGEVMNVLFAALIGGFSLGQAAPNLKYFQRGKASGAVVFKIIARKPVIGDATVQQLPAACEGNVALRNVHFAYPARPENPVFKDFCLQVPSGKTVALVGESGSGKSTVVGLIERFYDPQQGQVMLDGQDVRNVPLAWLRRQVGLVSQEPVLFATTIRQNIVFGRPGASQQEVEEAAKAANAHKFITSLPKGYDTTVGERGVQMSGGQKQRIAIARAILKNPKVLLLDEATSALDSESERLVQAALEGLMAGRTTLVVAHRLSTIMSADLIAVVRQGEIVEQGTHSDLILKPNGAYATLVRLQASAQHQAADDKQSLSERKLEISAEDPGVLQDLITTEKQTEVKRLEIVVDRQLEDMSNQKAGKAKKDKKVKEEKVNAGFIRLLGMNRPEWPWAIVGSASSAGLGVIMPAFALALSNVLGVFYNPDHAKMKSVIQTWCIVFGSVGAGALVCGTLQSYSFSLMGQKLAKRIRLMLMQALLKQEVGWYDKEENSSGAIAGRLSTDTLSIRGAVGDQLGLIIQNLVTIIGAYVIAFTAGWKMTLVITATVPLLGLSAWTNVKFQKGFFTEASKLFDNANQTAAEAVSSIRTVAAFSLQVQVSQLYEQQLVMPTKMIKRSSQTSGLGFGASQFIIFAVYAVGFWYGGREIAKGDLTFTEMLKVFFCIAFSAFGLASAQQAFPDITKASGAVKRVFAVIDRVPSILPNTSTGAQPKQGGGSVELRNVSFRYPARPEVQVFNEFSLKVDPGRSLALVGQSGSGKSTVISLIERFYDVEGGQVLVDGCDVRKMDLSFLRSQVGLVSQEPVLFSCTVRDNICYGKPDTTQGEVEKAAQAANAHSFIQKLPEGYSTQVGEGAIQLSGGQKQRVAIARAILKDPKILLLDEATSALDAGSERLVQDALDKLMVGRTTIVVAHRLSTIRNADTIAVVQQGQVVEQGSHDQLMQVPFGAYASLVRGQQRA
ncbi:MAG: ATP-binding cassette transporter [Trebouxia sp. A1-2]|nr:MAG: ATP-binding cassette transporter [Trebouxia sp. A1-2]